MRILREHEDEVNKPAPCVISITKSLISYRFKSWKIDILQSLERIKSYPVKFNCMRSFKL